jgi:hypothetical protein
MSKVFKVFERNNPNSALFLIGAYDEWERANNVVDFYKWLNPDNQAGAYIEESIDTKEG